MGSMLMFTMEPYWEKSGGYMCVIHIRTQSDNPTLSTEDHLPPMGNCSHTYAQERAASVSTATPEVKPHLTGGRVQKDGRFLAG